MDDLIVKQYQPKKRDEEAKVTRKLKNLNMKKLLILILVLLTAIALVILVVVVGQGLLGNPDMFIVGNGSTRTVLQWFQPRSDADLPQTHIFSISVSGGRIFFSASPWAYLKVSIHSPLMNHSKATSVQRTSRSNAEEFHYFLRVTITVL